jgi:hypothetical protein
MCGTITDWMDLAWLFVWVASLAFGQDFFPSGVQITSNFPPKPMFDVTACTLRFLPDLQLSGTRSSASENSIISNIMHETTVLRRNLRTRPLRVYDVVVETNAHVKTLIKATPRLLSSTYIDVKNTSLITLSRSGV